MEPLLLSDDERAVLERWTRRATSGLALRARIVLACAGPEVPPIVAVARDLRVTADTVRKWRRRFLAERLDGLADEPRPGGRHDQRRRWRRWWSPRFGTGAEIRHALVAEVDWRSHSGLSKSTVGRIWRQFQLKSASGGHLQAVADPLFVEKVYDVVGLYFNPPEGAVVLSWTRSHRSRHWTGPAGAAIMPGMPERRHHDYVRNGLTTLFAAFDITTGQVISSPASPSPAVEFQEVPDPDGQGGARALQVQPDRGQLRHHRPLRSSLAGQTPQVRAALHPTASSWINQVERCSATWATR